MTKPQPSLSDFPIISFDKLRFGDTDIFGHINNAVFFTCFETGRTDLLDTTFGGTGRGGHMFVLASTRIDFVGEMVWPGETRVGTIISAVGRSSMSLEQVMFQNDVLCATCSSTMVQVDPQSRRPAPISDALRAILEGLSRPAAG